MKRDNDSYLRVLIVENDDRLMRELYDYLEPRGYDLDSATSGPAGWQQAKTESYDAIIIDVIISGMDGLALCDKLRKEAHNYTPIIMITDAESIENRILCLNRGADDFVARPVSLPELEARIRALVRRARFHEKSRLITWNGLSLDPQRHVVDYLGKPLTLRPIGFSLLAMLMRNAPSIVTRADMERELYGDSPPDSDALRSHLHLLRTALKKAGADILLTVPHIGFRLKEESDGNSSEEKK